MKRSILFFLSALCLSVATVTYAGIEPVNTRLQGTDLSDLSGTATTMDLLDNKYWMIGAGVWFDEFDVQNIENRVIFGIDESDLTYESSVYSYRITLDIDYEVLEGTSLQSYAHDSIVLFLSYDPDRGTTYKDRDVFNFTGAVSMEVGVRKIEEEVGGNWSETTSIPSSFYLESEIATERYYDFDATWIPYADMDTATVDGELHVTWPYIAGAEEYDLEWTWINGYSGEISGGSPAVLSASSLSYDFDHNATRVRLSGQNTYAIPLIYGDGYIAIRYRGVGRGGSNNQIPIEGTWSSDNTSGSSGTLSDYANYYSVEAHEDNAFNYGAGMSFIENGVRSTGVTYMDGVLKPRQSQAKLNTQDKIIVGSTIYDHHGRPAVGVMSSPVDQSNLGYVDKLNMYDGTTYYDKDHFDLDQTPECGEYVAASEMDSVNSVGAANYYSGSNSDKEGYNAYLPTADGYPFVHVQYSPDPTGRIKRVGGLGPDHQIGETNGGNREDHYTAYFYTVPDDDELWQLFGNDAARPQNYTKVITKDVHGQISAALIDGMGRTVATYIEGAAPTGLDAIEGNDGADSTSKDFMPYNQEEDFVLEVNTPIVVTDTGKTYTFEYDFTGVSLTECLPVDTCFDCLYVLDIIITPLEDNECEIEDGSSTVISDSYGIVHITDTIGNLTSFDIDCDDPLVFSDEHPDDSLFTVKFGAIGEYQVIKRLRVAEDPIDYYWEQYVEHNTCLKTYEDFYDSLLLTIDPNACESFTQCEFKLLLDSGDVTTWLDNNPGQDSSDYETMKSDYLADCGALNSCLGIKPFLLMDMSPGGQYGSETTSDNLSVFNSTSNDLDGHWKSTGVVYYNTDGTPSYVDADGDGDYDDPPTDLDVEDFLDAWQESWAESLIQFHPEYCYYSFCLDYPEVADYEQDLWATETYDEACSEELINPVFTTWFEHTPCDTTNQDPIIEDLYDNLSSSDQHLVDSIMSDEYGSWDIYEYAVFISGDDPSAISFGDSCYADKHWKNFKVLYQSKRFQAIQIMKEQYVADSCSDAHCVGSSDPSCSTSPFNGSTPRAFDFESIMGYDLDSLSTTDWYAYADTAEMELDTICDSMCTNLATEWMSQLDSCDQFLSGGETWEAGQPTYDSVYTYLIKVCTDGCSDDCFSPTQNAPNVTSDTANHIFSSFAEVLEHFVGTDTTFCSNLLILYPEPGGCTDSVDNYLDECACEMLLASDSVEHFADLYGFEPIDYEAEKCHCEVYDANDDLDISGSEITDLADDSLFTSTLYGCPGECLDCRTLDELVSSFNSDHGIDPEDDTDFFTAYVNEDRSDASYTWEEIFNLMQACDSAGSSNTSEIFGMHTDSATWVYNLLAELSTDDLTTDGTYEDTDLPEYFYSGIYTCDSADTATFMYEPDITGNVLDFDIMGMECTGTCNISIDIDETLPGGMTATEFYQNITSFEEIYVVTADLVTGFSADHYDIFHINVVVDNDGSAHENSIKVTCCDFKVVEYDMAAEDEIYFTICDEVDIVKPYEDPCMDELLAEVELAADELYEEYLDAQYAIFVHDYKTKCAKVEDEEFLMYYDANRYHYTLLYYDLSGNLIKTVPPKGVDFLTESEVDDAIAYANSGGTAVYNSHTYETTYKHNALNQVVRVKTPDSDTSRYWYDEIGRLAISQNGRQYDFEDGLISENPETGTAIPAYSYTRYDEIGRVYEVGEIIHDDDMTYAIAKDQTSLDNWLDDDEAASTEDVVKNNITLIYYDEDYDSDDSLAFAQWDGEFAGTSADYSNGRSGYGFTRNRIVKTAIIEGYVNHTSGNWIYPEADYTGHYSYDVHGNVSSYLQEITELAPYDDNRFRRVDYEYDLISGNPNKIWFQRGKKDQFIHQYVYDGDNRLKEVWTSDDGQIWDRDVNYEYREDGYLARTELGEMKVQGMDYAYTLHGWLKALNSTTLDSQRDMGKDGEANSLAEYDDYEVDIHHLHAKDVLSYSIGYYKNDYNHIASGSGYDNMLVDTGNTAFSSDIDNLYNGNITSLITGTTKTDGTKQDPLATTYHYDQLHRFKESHVFTASDIITNNNLDNAARSNTTGPGGLGDYEVHVDYDMNGNITSLDRMAYTTNNDMDEFTYNYTSGTNKLDYVSDAVTTTGSSGYGDIQDGQAADNYEYHDDGSLRADEQEEIEYIDWYPSGKIKRIYRTSSSELSDVYFEYDAMGMRSLKVEMTRTGTTINSADDWKFTYYACDANGIVMSVYDFDSTNLDLTRIESMIYGGSRLGMMTETDSANTSLVEDCNLDGRATAVLKFGPTEPTAGTDIEVHINNTEEANIGSWAIGQIDDNVDELVDQINSDADGYYAYRYNVASNTYYLVIKEIIPGAISYGTVSEVELHKDDSEDENFLERDLTTGDCYDERVLGEKFYELTNHLGNVMEVISDRKVAADDGNGGIAYFGADVVSYSDYYPFGMELPNRNGTIAGGNYRYAFNGMEKDDEVSGEGNSYTTQFRQYDPRLGRWKSLDPLAGKFPWQSPFCGMDNNPIALNDVLGDSAGVQNKADAELIRDDLNALYKDKYGVENAFKIVQVSGYLKPYNEFLWGVGFEKIDKKIWAIVPNRSATKPDGTTIWDDKSIYKKDQPDPYRRRIYELLLVKGMVEIKMNRSVQGSYGSAADYGEVKIDFDTNKKYVPGEKSGGTYAATLLHEFIYHKHPDSEGKGNTMYRFYDFTPIRPESQDVPSLHEPANRVEYKVRKDLHRVRNMDENMARPKTGGSWIFDKKRRSETPRGESPQPRRRRKKNKKSVPKFEGEGTYKD